ncbi:MAG: hypothetical protein H0W68_06925, partial [Gemmatimonadaceae bacterium]|nr:hypothetical protein [Gemmatimonadaceae bacterium]
GKPDPSRPELDRIGADVLYEAGHWAEARARYAAVFARYPSDIESLVGTGASAAHVGDGAEAARVDDALATWTRPYALGHTTYGRARIAAALGDSSRTVALLGRSFRDGYPVVSIWERHVHAERDFGGWQTYAPFRELMGLP